MSTTVTSSQFTEWLIRAHQLESEQIPILEAHAQLARDLPEIRESLLRHHAETISHRDIVVQCLESLDQSPSTVKSAVAMAAGKAQGVASALFQDAVLRDMINDYAAESCEIALYTAIVAAARHLGLNGIADKCQAILDDEVEMAAWLQESIPDLTILTLEAVSARSEAVG